MTDDLCTAICLLIDRSGSMSTIREATERAINDFVGEQASASGRRTVRIATFSEGEPTTWCPSLPAVEVPSFVLLPAGNTALLDAMAITMTAFGAELAAMDEDSRPGHVVFAVMTDGAENSSLIYTWAQVQEMVAHQQDVYGWHVIYLGANQDAIEVGAALGIRRGSSLDYAANAHGTRSVVGSTQSYIDDVADGGSPEFTDDQRQDATGRTSA